MAGKRPENYQTRQGQAILEYMESLGDGHVTVSQIARHFADTEEAVGQTTVYRHLEKLAAGGMIRKYILHDDKSACYQYISGGKRCREHFHLKCESCGDLIHTDCDFLDEIARHLNRRHHFKINMLKTVFYGTCKKCLASAPAMARR
ncbi:MAG: transcriptional repressor [Treponema sp.]|jgi:Fur family ferric uptake transcriptional regulator|nr:transcriptional repressor [Treponema sp.]